ncbi:MAG: histidine kinase dimerization/phosphoacceptor domain -containing protein [Saprospiraceae bacterium]
MKKLIALAYYLCSISFIFSQSPQLDSLERLYSTFTIDTQRLALLDQMTDLAYDVDLHIALVYAKRGVTLAEKISDKNWRPKFYEIQGRVYANLVELDSALLLFDKAMEGYKAVGNKKGQATTYFKIGWVYKHKGEVDKAMDGDLFALRLMEELNDQAGIAGALSRVAEDMRLQGRNSEAMVYAQRAITICEKNNLRNVLPYTLRDAGDIALGSYDFVTALQYYNRALALVQTMNSGFSDVADFTNSHGNALKRMGRYEEALKDYKTTLEISQKQNYPSGISTALANLGETNLLMGNFAAALPYQLKTIGLQEEVGDLSNLTENYEHVSTIYEHLGDYKLALLYQKKSRHMRDSTASIASDQAMSELSTKYETEKKEATISIQEARLGQQQKMQWLYIGLAVLLGLFAISFYRNALSRKKSNTLLSAKNAENELLLKEIHHRVKNNLEVVSSLLALQSAQIDDQDIKEAMQEGQNRVQSIGIVHQKLYQGTNLGAVEMKDYFINLSESILDSFGADDRVTIECAMNNLELDIDTAVPLGLITNEILTNALKYAFPDGRKGHIEIKLEQKDDDTLQLMIADNGIGKSDVIHGTGFGGQLVSLLTRQLSGSMREEVKGGTTIYFDFNLKKAG